MSEESVDARPLTSVELLDAAVWREIGSEEAQPASVFLDALSRLVGRWLLVRSDAPEMDAVTVLCKGTRLYRTPRRRPNERERVELVTQDFGLKRAKTRHPGSQRVSGV